MTPEDVQREICRAFEVTPEELGLWVGGSRGRLELANKEYVNGEWAACLCGDTDPAGCMYLAAGYPWCQPCGDHHRAPECAVDSDGFAVEWCGCRWVDLDARGHTCKTYGDNQ